MIDSLPFIFDSSLVRVSMSEFDFNPMMKIKLLNSSTVMFVISKSSHALFTRPQYVKMSVSSFLNVFRHLKRLLNNVSCRLKIFFKVFTVSRNVSSVGFFGKMQFMYFECADVSSLSKSNRIFALSSSDLASFKNI